MLTSGPPLQSVGLGTSGEWVYSLTMTLEELFGGKHCRFCIVRHLLSGRSKSVVIELDIPPGCQRGTQILCRSVGHEISGGRLQDVAFIVEEATHERFSRVQDDLFLNIRILWTDDLRRQPKKVCIRGLDGEDIGIFIDYSRDKMLNGKFSVKGAGMPIREKGQVRGRGNLIIR